jgi:hypothetical protein
MLTVRPSRRRRPLLSDDARAAISLYSKAANAFMAAGKVETNLGIRASLQQKTADYLRRVEFLTEALHAQALPQAHSRSPAPAASAAGAAAGGAGLASSLPSPPVSPRAAERTGHATTGVEAFLALFGPLERDESFIGGTNSSPVASLLSLSPPPPSSSIRAVG